MVGNSTLQILGNGIQSQWQIRLNIHLFSLWEGAVIYIVLCHIESFDYRCISLVQHRRLSHFPSIIFSHLCCNHYSWKSSNHSSGPPTIPTLSCVEDVTSGTVNVTVSWTLSGGDSADFYLINITTNAPQTPYGRLLNITASVTQHELTGFMAGYEYNITVRGSCGNQEVRESDPLTITPQGQLILVVCTLHALYYCV